MNGTSDQPVYPPVPHKYSLIFPTIGLSYLYAITAFPQALSYFPMLCVSRGDRCGRLAADCPGNVSRPVPAIADCQLQLGQPLRGVDGSGADPQVLAGRRWSARCGTDRIDLPVGTSECDDHL